MSSFFMCHFLGRGNFLIELNFKIIDSYFYLSFNLYVEKTKCYIERSRNTIKIKHLIALVFIETSII